MFVMTIAKTFNTLPLEMAKIVTVLISFLLLTYCQTVIAMSHVKVIQPIKNVVVLPNGVFIAVCYYLPKTRGGQKPSRFKSGPDYLEKRVKIFF